MTGKKKTTAWPVICAIVLVTMVFKNQIPAKDHYRIESTLSAALQIPGAPSRSVAPSFPKTKWVSLPSASWQRYAHRERNSTLSSDAISLL